MPPTRAANSAPARTNPPPIPSGRRWWVLLAMCTAQLMVVLDATIVNIALPDAQRSLGFGDADRQWVVTAYALTFGGLLLIGGRVADRMGRRTAILVGLTGFGLASALGGAAAGLPMLVAARALQGVFGALLAPATLAVITTTFTDPRQRGKAFGIYGSVSAGGGAIGLLLGGVLTEYATWRWTLYVNAVLAVAGVLAVLATLAHHEREHGHKHDLAGTTSITIGLFALVFGFSNAARHGWTAPLTLACLAAGVLLTVVFLAVEARVTAPVLPLRVLASRVRGASLLVLFLGSVGLFAEILFLTFYLQDNLGFSPVQAGLAFLPQTVAVVGASLGSGVLLRRLPGAVLIPFGMAVAAGGTLLLAGIDTTNRYATVVLPAVVLIGAGLGLALSVAINLGVQGVSDDDAGVASATVNAVQQMGGSIGPSLFNTIASSVLVGYLASRGGGAVAGPAGDRLRALAEVHSYSVCFQIAAAILLAAALTSGLMLARHPRRSDPEDARGQVAEDPAVAGDSAAEQIAGVPAARAGA